MLAVGVLGGAGCSQETPPPPLPTLASNAPQDQPFESKGREAVEEYRAAIAPYVEQARKTYPGAKQRFLDGLPPGQVFFAVCRLQDRTGATEQVFVAVADIRDGRIKGRIASDIRGVSGYKQGDVHTFPETELIDWLISHPDGTEEGNVVGKFLDEWQKTRRGH